MTGGWHGKADHRVPGFRPAPGGGDRCGTVCRWEHRRQLLRGHAAVSTSARRPGGRIDRGRATGLPVAPIRLRRRERADVPRTPTDFRQDPRTRNDVQDADESLASWTRHRIGVRQRHRRPIAGAPARFAFLFGEPRPQPRSARPYFASLDRLTMADGSIGCDLSVGVSTGLEQLVLLEVAPDDLR